MDDLGAQERAVLELITANPFAGQQDIANMLGLARSTVAAHVVQLVQKGYILGRGYVLPASKRIAVLGGAVFDRKYHARAPLISATSNPVDGHRSFGGVARNVAENLARLGVTTSFVSIVGDDDTGRSIIRHLRDLGVDTSQIIVTGEAPTAEYAAILGMENELVLGIADMGIFDLFQPAHLDRAWPHLAAASWVFADCNLPDETLRALITRKQGARFRLAIDTVSSPKARRLPKDLTGIDILFLNLDEAHAVLGRHENEPRLSPEEATDRLRAGGICEVVLTMGAAGLLVSGAEGMARIDAVPAQPVDVTGAGDAMIAGTLYSLLTGANLANGARTGSLLATLTTENKASVHPLLSPQFLAAHLHRIPERTPL
ncbi:winged helix-turn-helix transcriptional regulator [Phyllobacterium salinisoli]|uniref:Winged helix-turn-helix transcriptional regulator n=1 Tax=Phyllobacterium salinisoli TaxID=1899321 RepID=A0A368K7Y4_9HYPH|nr:carbohydrate kinase [Phyllobacterium salinisoli]RCS24735.1 winged helix-turn-helix transcriptional regulator [Phyllobacterium salinisoli]